MRFFINGCLLNCLEEILRQIQYSHVAPLVFFFSLLCQWNMLQIQIHFLSCQDLRKWKCTIYSVFFGSVSFHFNFLSVMVSLVVSPVLGIICYSQMERRWFKEAWTCNQSKLHKWVTNNRKNNIAAGGHMVLGHRNMSSEQLHCPKSVSHALFISIPPPMWCFDDAVESTVYRDILSRKRSLKATL